MCLSQKYPQGGKWYLEMDDYQLDFEELASKNLPTVAIVPPCTDTAKDAATKKSLSIFAKL